MESNKAPPRDITASVLLVVAGCVVAGIGDFSFDLKGCVPHSSPVALEAVPYLVVGTSAVRQLRTLEIVMIGVEHGTQCCCCVPATRGNKSSWGGCRYTFALLSCVLQAAYLILVERSGAEKGVGTTELLYINALLSLPFLAVVCAPQPTAFPNRLPITC